MKKLQYNSPVILSYFFISSLALVLGFITNDKITYSLFSVYNCSLLNPLAYVRFFGHVLGHADLNHFLGNMLLFLVVGPPLEEKYGSSTLLVGIIFTALISGLLQFFFFPRSVLLGASGIVFMLIMLSSLAGMKNGKIPVTLILVAIMYLGKEVYSMLFVADNVANLMHIVGGACGTFFGFLVGKKRLNSYY